MFDKSRRIQRVTLQHPLRAVAGGERAYVVDASVRGVRLTHSGLFSQGIKCNVTFEWNGQPIEFVGRIRWTKAQRGGTAPVARNTYQSGFEIDFIKSTSASALQALVQKCVERALDEQKANVKGIPPEAASSLQVTPSKDCVRHELIHGVWRKTITTDRRQPESGFTVSADEPRHQVEMLRAAFEAADTSLRQTIQKLAELSISGDDAIPFRKYTP